jgi:signal transduction histidine kinase
LRLLPRPKSIRQRFTYTLAAVVGGTFVVLSVIFIIYNSRSLEKDLQLNLDNLTRLTVNGLSTALWQYNYEYIDDYLDSLFLNEGIVFVTIYAEKQLIRQKARPDLANKQAAYFLSSRSFITKQANILYQGAVIGELQLSMSREHVSRMLLKDSGIAVLIFCLIISGIFVTMFVLLQKYLFQPLASLEDSARLISKGRLHTEINTRSEDEIGHLARVLDQMRKELTITMASRDELEAEIAERKRTEEENEKLTAQLLQSQKMEAIGTLAGGIAHDFNNILASIIGFTELALEEAPQGSSIKNDLEEVLIAGNRAKELVQQILAFARKSEKKTQPVRLNDIVTEALKLLRPSTPTTIEIKQHLYATENIMGNSSQLNQVVMNLCTNAIHSLKKTGGTLEIFLRSLIINNDPKFSDGEYAELTVSDNGPGIDPAIIDRIFEPYFTSKDVGEGSGMGLAMVKGIIESYRGHIEVKSEPGVKTSFVIRLPVVAEENLEVANSLEDAPPGTEHILLVDDEPPIARIGRRLLENLGYSVVMRTSSYEALELFKEKPDAFDLIITDMTMPYMTGDKLSIEIRKIRRDIPIILCTGYSNRIDEEGTKEIDINAFIYKPFTRHDLAKTVRDVLDI